MKKETASESIKTRKVREKLAKKMAAENEQLTPEALKDTVQKIHQWIADNAKERIVVKTKGIRLFNQNEDAAAVSKRVEKLRIDMMARFG